MVEELFVSIIAINKGSQYSQRFGLITMVRHICEQLYANGKQMHRKHDVDGQPRTL